MLDEDLIQSPEPTNPKPNGHPEGLVSDSQQSLVEQAC